MLIFTFSAKDHHFERLKFILWYFSKNLDRHFGHTRLNHKINASHGVFHLNFSHQFHLGSVANLPYFIPFSSSLDLASAANLPYIFVASIVQFQHQKTNKVFRQDIGLESNWIAATLHTKPHHRKSYTTDCQVFALGMVLWQRRSALRNAASAKYLVYMVKRSTKWWRCSVVIEMHRAQRACRTH